MSGIPVIDASQMARIDWLMKDRFGVEPIQLMEVAGLQVARYVRSLLLRGSIVRNVVVLAGSGGNGGDALVATRYLHAWSVPVTVVLSKPATAMTGLAARHLASLDRLGVPVLEGAAIDALPEAGLIVDGLLGFSAKGLPRGETARLIRWANAANAHVLAIDVPSGLDATTGIAHLPHIVANATLVLAMLKIGLVTPGASAATGNLVLADIGIPPEAYAMIGLPVPRDLFARQSFLSLGDTTG